MRITQGILHLEQSNLNKWNFKHFASPEQTMSYTKSLKEYAKQYFMDLGYSRN